jgi:hypothetical protein
MRRLAGVILLSFPFGFLGGAVDTSTKTLSECDLVIATKRKASLQGRWWWFGRSVDVADLERAKQRDGHALVHAGTRPGFRRPGEATMEVLRQQNPTSLSS